MMSLLILKTGKHWLLWREQSVTFRLQVLDAGTGPLLQLQSCMHAV